MSGILVTGQTELGIVCRGQCPGKWGDSKCVKCNFEKPIGKHLWAPPKENRWKVSLKQVLISSSFAHVFWTRPPCVCITFRASAGWGRLLSQWFFWESLMVTVFTSVYSAKAYSPLEEKGSSEIIWHFNHQCLLAGQISATSFWYCSVHLSSWSPIYLGDNPLPRSATILKVSQVQPPASTVCEPNLLSKNTCGVILGSSPSALEHLSSWGQLETEPGHPPEVLQDLFIWANV